ncbi:hypothetical protein D3C81_1847530 [compost metagenome]
MKGHFHNCRRHIGQAILSFIVLGRLAIYLKILVAVSTVDQLLHVAKDATPQLRVSRPSRLNDDANACRPLIIDPVCMEVKCDLGIYVICQQRPAVDVIVIVTPRVDAITF